MELAQIVRLLDYNKILRFLEMIRDKSQLNLLLQNKQPTYLNQKLPLRLTPHQKYLAVFFEAILTIELFSGRFQ